METPTRAYLFNWKKIEEAVNEAKREDSVGFDIEVSSLEKDAKVAGFSFYLPKANKSYYVPIYHEWVDKEGIAHSHNDLRGLPRILELIVDLPVVTYKGDFDLGRLKYWYGLYPRPVGDGLIAGKMLQLNTWKGLKEASEDLGLRANTKKIADVLGEGCFDFTKAPLDETTLEYTCQDAELAYYFEKVTKEKHLKREKYKNWDFVYQLELDCMPILGEIEFNGIRLDRERFKKTVEIINREAEDLHDEICEVLGRDSESFNIASTQRLSAALFNAPNHEPKPLKKGQHLDLEMPGLGLKASTPKTKTGGYSTSIENLEMVVAQHPIIERIQRWKSLNSILTKDVVHVDEWAKNDEINPRFVQIGIDGTARIYTASPNVISMAREVRDAMVPKQGKVFVHIDYKGAEFRICALLSGEQKILDALDKGLDPHKYTYSRMMKIPYEEVSAEDREKGKVLNYAALFGTMGYSVARQLKISQLEAKKLLEGFWNENENMAIWRDYRYTYALQHARTYTVIGRVRRFPEVFGKNWKLKGEVKRQAVNTACQGSCGDALKLGIRNLDRAGGRLEKYKMKILCPVFDAVLLELDREALSEKVEVEEEIRDAFEVQLEHEDRNTRMKCDLGWSEDSWLHAMGKKMMVTKESATAALSQ